MDPMDAILYQHAAQARDIWLRTLFAEDEVTEHQFSRPFERKMARLLRQERRSPRMKQTVHILKRTAAAVLVLLSVSFAGLMSVEAYREKVIEVVTKVFHELTEYRYYSHSANTELPEVSFAYVPEGMKEVHHTVKPGDRSHIIYENEQGQFFALRQTVLLPNEFYFGILNTEDAITEKITIRGYEAMANSKLGDQVIKWNEHNVIYSMHSNLSMEELVKIAEHMQTK